MYHWIQIHHQDWKKQPERILPTGIPSKWPWGWNQKWDLPVKCSLEILKTPTSSGYVCLHTSMLSCLSCIRLSATVWAVGGQAPLSMGFSRQEYWSGLLCPPPGDLSDPGIERTCGSWGSCTASRLFTAEPPRKPLQAISIIKIHRNKNPRSAVFKWW